MEKINLAEGLMAQMMEEEAWKRLSGSFGFTLQMLEKYQDKLDWKEAINSYDYNNRLNRAFFDKYREYIPASAFKDSTLWQNIVQEIRKDIENGIRNGE